MCVCISHTCLTLNNRFQTKMGCWGGAATEPKCQTWLIKVGGRHRRRPEGKGRERAPRPTSPELCPCQLQPTSWCCVDADWRGAAWTLLCCWRTVAAEREGRNVSTTWYGDTWCARFRAALVVPSCVDFGRGIL